MGTGNIGRDGTFTSLSFGSVARRNRGTSRLSPGIQEFCPDAKSKGRGFFTVTRNTYVARAPSPAKGRKQISRGSPAYQSA